MPVAITGPILLDRTQVRPQRGLVHRLGIVVVVLLALHEGIDVNRRDDPRLVPQSADTWLTKMRAQAGFHANDARRELLEGVFETQSPDLLRKAIFPSEPNPTR